MITVANIKPQNQIAVSLVETNFLQRRPCHVCGGWTDKVSILAEVESGEHKGFRVCECCIEQGGIDEKLIARAANFDDQAKELRELVGRLVLPSFTDWHQRQLECGIECMRQHLDYSDDQIVKELIEDIARDLSDATYTEVRRNWLMQRSMTTAQIDARVTKLRAELQAKHSILNQDIPF